MSKLHSRVVKLEGVNPAPRYTAVEREIVMPSPDGPRATGDVLRRVVGGDCTWMRRGAGQFAMVVNDGIDP